MKVLLSLITFAPLLAFGSEISIGDTLERTIGALGEPVGTIELQDKSLLLYPEGEITLKNDLVTQVDLMSPEEFAADQARLKAAREEWALIQERRAAARKVEGEALKASKLQNRKVAILPAKDKLDYWRKFQARYPDVDASTEIARALENHEQEISLLKKQQEISELQARLAQAEKEAAEAKLETEKLRLEAKNQRSRTNYGLRYYTTPIYTPRYNCQPPTITIYSNGTTAKHKLQSPCVNDSNTQTWKRSYTTTN